MYFICIGTDSSRAAVMAFLTLAAPLLFLLLQLPQQVQLADDLQGGQAMWLDPTSHCRKHWNRGCHRGTL